MTSEIAKAVVHQVKRNDKKGINDETNLFYTMDWYVYSVNAATPSPFILNSIVNLYE